MTRKQILLCKYEFQNKYFTNFVFLIFEMISFKRGVYKSHLSHLSKELGAIHINDGPENQL